jgi:CubicO group peptidase (beta-lactamase class C family)
MSVRRRLASIVIAALAAAAAARGQQPAPAPPSAALAQDPRVASALELARAWLEAQRAYERIPGISVAIVHDQDLLWEGGFGLADVADGRPATADTLYSICSISKLFTSVAVMQQRDAGRLRLDDPVSRRLTWFHLKRGEGEGDVTIEGLLTHASGLPQEPGIAYWSAPDFAFPTHDEIVAKIPTLEALYAPESNFQYSNIGFTLLGEIVAATSCKAKEVVGDLRTDHVQSHVIGPGVAAAIPVETRARRCRTGGEITAKDILVVGHRVRIGASAMGCPPPL